MDLTPFNDHVGGSFRDGKGRTFSGVTTRLKRRQVDELIAQGVPLVLQWFGGGQLEWLEGDGARTAWAERRGSYVSQLPARPPKDVLWTGGEAMTANRDARVVLLEGHC